MDDTAKKEWQKRMITSLAKMLTALKLADNSMDEAVNSAAKIVALFEELKVQAKAGAGRDDNGKFFVEFLLIGPNGEKKVIRLPSYDDSFLDSLNLKI